MSNRTLKEPREKKLEFRAAMLLILLVTLQYQKINIIVLLNVVVYKPITLATSIGFLK